MKKTIEIYDCKDNEKILMTIVMGKLKDAFIRTEELAKRYYSKPTDKYRITIQLEKVE